MRQPLWPWVLETSRAYLQRSEEKSWSRLWRNEWVAEGSISTLRKPWVLGNLQGCIDSRAKLWTCMWMTRLWYNCISTPSTRFFLLCLVRETFALETSESTRRRTGTTTQILGYTTRGRRVPNCRLGTVKSEIFLNKIGQDKVPERLLYYWEFSAMKCCMHSWVSIPAIAEKILVSHVPLTVIAQLVTVSRGRR